MLPAALILCREGTLLRFPPPQPLKAGKALYALAWTALLADSPLGPKPKRLIKRFYHQLASDFDGYALRGANLAKELMQDWETLPDALALRPQRSRDRGALIDAVARELIRYSRKPSSEVLQYLLTFLQFGKRVSVGTPDELVSKAVRSWKEVEARLAALELPEWVDDLRKIINHTFTPYFKHVPLPVHGGGHVAEQGISSLCEKDSRVGYDLLARKAFSHFGLDEFSHDYWPTDVDQWDCGIIHPARVHFVYKDLFNVRTICMEPARKQLAQQSVRLALESGLSDSPYWRVMTVLADQTYNSLAAQQGSLHNLTDTLDLSSASDSVALSLVRRIFPPGVLKLLLATRSQGVLLPSGELIAVKKFAPMGSAVCFPVQCLVYGALIIRCYLNEFYDGRVDSESIDDLFRCLNNDGGAFVSGFGAIRVYGDDLICDSRVTRRLIDDLTSLGFVVNQGKSFTSNSSFRESCGGYYVLGADCTPFSLKIGEVDDQFLTPSVLAGLLDACNRLLKIGYHSCRDYLLKVAHLWESGRGREQLPRPLKYGDADGELHGLPIMEVRYKLRRYGAKTPMTSTCGQYQRDEGRFLVITTDKTVEFRNEQHSYNRWMRSPYNSVSSFRKDRENTKDHELRFGWAWLPV